MASEYLDFRPVSIEMEGRIEDVPFPDSRFFRDDCCGIRTPMAHASTITEADILMEVVNPNAAGLSADVARSILDLRFSERARRRMQELLDHSNKGRITPEEQSELEKYRRVGLFLDLMQAKARLSLAPPRSP